MRRVRGIMLTAAVAVVMSGCSALGGGGADQPSAPPATQNPSTAASDPTQTATPTAPASDSVQPSATASGSAAPTPADPSQPSSGDQLGAVVATRVSSFGRAKVTMKLYPVLRSGRTSHVNLSLTSPTTGIQGQISDAFSDSNPKASDATPFAADGLQLVDAKNAKLYLVASDGAGTCLCSRNLSNAFVRDNNPVLISATFAAPPEDVTAVDVRSPTFGLVKSVPVQ